MVGNPAVWWWETGSLVVPTNMLFGRQLPVIGREVEQAVFRQRIREDTLGVMIQWLYLGRIVGLLFCLLARHVGLHVIEDILVIWNLQRCVTGRPVRILEI